MKICPKCKVYSLEQNLEICPNDNWGLVEEEEYTKAMDDPFLGALVDGRFRIIGRAGIGAMSTVYKAIQLSMNRIVALKILRNDLGSDKAVVQRFFREAKATSLLKHPNTITIFDFGYSEEGLLYIAMEYLEGKLLSTILEMERQIDIPRAVKIVFEVALSLAEAHRKGIIHRDLKPSNIMITQIEGQEGVKVLDFGIAKIIRGDLKIATMETQDGTIFGTPRYMSPEQAKGENLDHRTDLYSLGVIFYQMVTGVTPFDDEDAIVIMAKHIKDPPTPPSKIRPDLIIPVEVEAIIMKLLEKDRNKRFQSAEELILALKKLNLEQLEITSSIINLPPPPTLLYYSYKKKLALYGLIILVFLLIGSIFGWIYLYKRPNLKDPKKTLSTMEPLFKGNKSYSKKEDLFTNFVETAKVKITINSEPKEASIYKDDTFIGKTPLTIGVEKGKLQKFLLKLNGYRVEELEIIPEKDSYFLIPLSKVGKKSPIHKKEQNLPPPTHIEEPYPIEQKEPQQIIRQKEIKYDKFNF